MSDDNIASEIAPVGDTNRTLAGAIPEDASENWSDSESPASVNFASDVLPRSDTSNAARPKMDKKQRTHLNKDVVRLHTFDSTNEGYHRLQSIEPRMSQVELLAQRIETRMKERVPITWSVRKKFLHKCLKVAKRKNYEDKLKIRVEDVAEMRNKHLEYIENKGSIAKFGRKFVSYLGCKTDNNYMMDLLDRAHQRCEDNRSIKQHDFYYRDFNQYHTRIESRWVFVRIKSLNAMMGVLLFYIFTPILFCAIMNDPNICPADPTDNCRSYYGWVTSLYFASATLSTVGYGDISITGDSDRWRILVASVYLTLGLLIMSLLLTSAIDDAFQPVSIIHKKILNLMDMQSADTFAYQRLRKIRILIWLEILGQFTLINLVGFGASIAFQYNERTWDWARSLYWSLQTTTTVGYGDISVPFEMYWFMIFYLIIGTYFVGSAIGRVGEVSSYIKEEKKKFAWRRRQLSKAMIKDMKPAWKEGEFEAIDQFEYVIASLLTLGKISSDDINPIMDKFRMMCKLSGDPGLLEAMEVVEAAEAPQEILGEEGSRPLNVEELVEQDLEGDKNMFEQLAIDATAVERRLLRQLGTLK